MFIITSLLLTLFASPTLLGSEPTDLCDIVHPDTGTPLYCDPHPDGAPVFDDAVCCDGGHCVKSEGPECPDSLEQFYCELGDVNAANEVDCYFEVPNYCDVHPCEPGYQTQPQAAGMCCSQGVCWTIWALSGDCELGDIYWCSDGVSNEDGTVTCFDDE